MKKPSPENIAAVIQADFPEEPTESEFLCQQRIQTCIEIQKLEIDRFVSDMAQKYGWLNNPRPKRKGNPSLQNTLEPKEKIKTSTIQELAKEIGIGPNICFGRLRASEFLRRDNLPSEPCLKNGYLAIEYVPYTFSSGYTALIPFFLHSGFSEAALRPSIHDRITIGRYSGNRDWITISSCSARLPPIPVLTHC